MIVGEGMGRPRISVAMCSYNMAAFVEPQLDSIARQTRRPDELVVCDDGSEDRTVEIVRSFAARVPFDVRIVRNEQRLGCNKNFEQAISLCTGDIIFLCDHDDVWHPEKIALIAGLMQDDNVGAAFGNAEVVGDDLVPKGFTLWDTCDFNPERRKRFAAGDQFPELIANNVMQGAAAAFKASLRPAILPIPREWPHDYWIALIASLGSGIRFTERCVLDYRQHGGNLIGAGMPYRNKTDDSAFKKFGRRVERWIRKVRGPSRYYGRSLAKVRQELQPLSVLHDRLMQLDCAVVAPAMSLVDKEIAQLTRRQAELQKKMRAWAWTTSRPGSAD
jgi:glycosyltransferase involved in cell wall biosynthesis